MIAGEKRLFREYIIKCVSSGKHNLRTFSLKCGTLQEGICTAQVKKKAEPKRSQLCYCQDDSEEIAIQAEEGQDML